MPHGALCERPDADHQIVDVTLLVHQPRRGRSLPRRPSRGHERPRRGGAPGREPRGAPLLLANPANHLLPQCRAGPASAGCSILLGRRRPHPRLCRRGDPTLCSTEGSVPALRSQQWSLHQLATWGSARLGRVPMAGTTIEKGHRYTLTLEYRPDKSGFLPMPARRSTGHVPMPARWARPEPDHRGSVQPKHHRHHRRRSDTTATREPAFRRCNLRARHRRVVGPVTIFAKASASGAPTSRRSLHARSETTVESLDEATIPRRLPSGYDMVHHVAEGDPRIRVGEAHGTPGSVVAECCRGWARTAVARSSA